MQALVWIVRFVIIVILVWFALKNSQQVEVKGFPGQVWETPLVFALLVAFIAGVVMGLLAWIPTVVRQSPGWKWPPQRIATFKAAAAFFIAAPIRFRIAGSKLTWPFPSSGHRSTAFPDR